MSIVMKIKNGKFIFNKYVCAECESKGIKHKVIDMPGPPTDTRSDWGAGLPTTMRKCTACDFQDGP
jgi:hypothetical protein